MVGGRETQLQVTRALARRASLRAMVGRFVSLLGVGLVGMGGLLLVAVLIGKVAGQSFDLALPGVLAAAAAVVGSSIVAATGRWSERAAAIEIDHAMGLDDALSSALDLANDDAGNDQAFTSLAMSDAERAAARIDAKVIAPIGLGLSWLAWPIVGAAVVGASMFIPEYQRERAEAVPGPLAVSEEQAAAEVDAAIEAVQETIAQESEAGATPEQLEMLDELERELAAGETTADEAVRRTAEALDERAKVIEDEAQREALAQDALNEKLDEVDPDSLDEASDLAKAMRDGDMEAARRAVEEMSRTVDDLSQEQRESLAEDLGRLADQLDESAASDTDQTQSLEDQGLTPEQAQELAAETDPDKIAEKLSDAGMDPKDAQQAAEEIAEQNRENRAEEEAREQTRDMSDSIRQASEQLKEPPDQQPPDQGEQEDTANQDEGKPDKEQGQAGDERQSPGEQSDPESSGQQQGQEQEQESTDPNAANEQREGTQDDPSGESKQPDPNKHGQEQSEGQNEEQGNEQGEGTEQGSGEKEQRDPTTTGQESSQDPGKEQTKEQDPGGEQKQPDATKPDDESGEGRREQQGQEQSPSGDESEQTKPGQEQGDPNDSQPNSTGRKPGEQADDGQSPDAMQSGEGDSEQPDSNTPSGNEPTTTRDQMAPGSDSQSQSPRESLRDLKRQFDRLDSARDKAQDDQASAQELRERAQEMLEEMTPEERKEMLDRWSQMQRDRQAQGTPTDQTHPTTDPAYQDADRVDMSRPDKEATDRVIARWLNDGEGDPNAPVQPNFSGTVRRSRESAEKAFEQQRIPRRHQDLVRRVFDRFAQRADAGEDKSAGDAPAQSGSETGTESKGSGGN